MLRHRWSRSTRAGVPSKVASWFVVLWEGRRSGAFGWGLGLGLGLDLDLDLDWIGVGVLRVDKCRILRS